MPSENPSHKLVEDAYELMQEKLEQDEITIEDIEECQEALDLALDHEESDIFVTMTCAGPRNTLEHQRYPDGEYQWEPPESKREAIQGIVDHEIKVTVS